MMIKITIGVVIAVTLVALTLLNTSYPYVGGRYVFSVFVMFITGIKIWESFFTSKEKEATKYHGDWTLVLTSLLYLAAGVMMAWEFFNFNRGFSLTSVVLGLGLLLSAIVLRYWSIKSLGDQWAIHVSGQSQLPHELALVTQGPYKYVRHPIYLSYIVELLGLAILFSAFYSLIFVCVINIPSYIIRSQYEEKEAGKRLGERYLVYKKNTSFMAPLKRKGTNK